MSEQDDSSVPALVRNGGITFRHMMWACEKLLGDSIRRHEEERRRLQDLERQTAVLRYINSTLAAQGCSDEPDMTAKDQEALDEWEGRDMPMDLRVGNAIADAQMFLDGKRSDPWTYKETYGLTWTQVLEWLDSEADDGELIVTLNAYATRLQQHKSMTYECKVAFDDFVEEVEKNWLEPPNKDPQTPLGIAYDRFWEQLKQQDEIAGMARLDNYAERRVEERQALWNS